MLPNAPLLLRQTQKTKVNLIIKDVKSGEFIMFLLAILTILCYNITMLPMFAPLRWYGEVSPFGWLYNTPRI